GGFCRTSTNTNMCICTNSEESLIHAYGLMSKCWLKLMQNVISFFPHIIGLRPYLYMPTNWLYASCIQSNVNENANWISILAGLVLTNNNDNDNNDSEYRSVRPSDKHKASFWFKFRNDSEFLRVLLNTFASETKLVHTCLLMEPLGKWCSKVPDSIFHSAEPEAVQFVFSFATFLLDNFDDFQKRIIPPGEPEKTHMNPFTAKELRELDWRDRVMIQTDKHWLDYPTLERQLHGHTYLSGLLRDMLVFLTTSTRKSRKSALDNQKADHIFSILVNSIQLVSRFGEQARYFKALQSLSPGMNATPVHERKEGGTNTWRQTNEQDSQMDVFDRIVENLLTGCMFLLRWILEHFPKRKSNVRPEQPKTIALTPPKKQLNFLMNRLQINTKLFIQDIYSIFSKPTKTRNDKDKDEDEDENEDEDEDEDENEENAEEKKEEKEEKEKHVPLPTTNKSKKKVTRTGR
ncbi:thioredoxin family protein, partial [Reticulomyxa filosa]